MSIIKKHTKYQNQLHANVGSDDKKQDSPHDICYFSKNLAIDIAKTLGNNKPDIAAAVVVYKIWEWQRARYKYPGYDSRGKFDDGTLAAFRSTRQLAKDIGFLTNTAILRAIRRCQKALPELFITKKTTKGFLFGVNYKLSNKYEFSRIEKSRKIRRPVLAINKEIAKKYGICEGILYQNLKQKTLKGYEWNKISPNVFSKYLPFSEGSIRQAIARLKKGQIITQSETKSGTYKLIGVEVGSNPDIEVFLKPEVELSDNMIEFMKKSDKCERIYQNYKEARKRGNTTTYIPFLEINDSTQDRH